MRNSGNVVLALKKDMQTRESKENDGGGKKKKTQIHRSKKKCDTRGTMLGGGEVSSWGRKTDKHADDSPRGSRPTRN